MRLLVPGPPSRESRLARQRQIELHQRRQIHYAKPNIHRVPSSPETLLGGEFIQTLTYLHYKDSWYAFVPSLLGANSAVDAAAKAVIRAHNLSLIQGPAEIARCDASYMRAITTLRNSLDLSDSALLSVGLLSLFETILKSQPRALFSHAGGISAILLARSRSSPATPLGRAFLYANTHGTFQEPCMLGIASPFDDPYWWGLEPISLESTTPEARTLRKLSNQLFIRIPGLVQKVRSLRQSAGVVSQHLAKAIELSHELGMVHDDNTENTLLHRVVVSGTVDTFDKTVVPYSFKFLSPYEKETLLLYWSARLMVAKLCVVTDGLRRTNHFDAADAPALDITKLDNDQDRMIMNVLMTWQDGFGQVNPLSIVWGALMDKQTFRGRPIQNIRMWVRTRYHDVLAGWPIKFSTAEMDEESEVMAGGPLGGIISQISRDIKGRV